MGICWRAPVSEPGAPLRVLESIVLICHRDNGMKHAKEIMIIAMISFAFSCC